MSQCIWRLWCQNQVSRAWISNYTILCNHCYLVPYMKITAINQVIFRVLWPPWRCCVVDWTSKLSNQSFLIPQWCCNLRRRGCVVMVACHHRATSYRWRHLCTELGYRIIIICLYTDLLIRAGKVKTQLLWCRSSITMIIMTRDATPSLADLSFTSCTDSVFRDQTRYAPANERCYFVTSIIS